MSLSDGRYSVTFTPLVTSCTAVPTEVGLAPYFAASDLLTFIFQSMPGSGRPSSRSRMSLRSASSAATFFAAAGSASGLSPPIWTCTGLPVGGPPRGAVTSIETPGMSAVAVRISAMISRAVGRTFQSENSYWMMPIVSSVISEEPRGCSPTRV